EALTFAEKVVVMYDGQIVQIGTPAELFERPRHTFVGYFIGSPGMNVLPVELSGSEARIGDVRIALAAAPAQTPAGPLEIGIRPEFIRLGREGMPVEVAKVEDTGRRKIVRARLQGRDVALIAGEHDEIPSDPHISFDQQAINLYANSWLVEPGAP